jgi:hypothetical protein
MLNLELNDVNGGTGLIPSPKYTVSPNYFYYGNMVLGGYVVVNFNGTHHAPHASGLYETKNALLNTLNSCQTLTVTNRDTGLIPFFSGIDECVGQVRDVKVSEGSDPLNLNYSISVHCSIDRNKRPLIGNNTGYNFPSGMVVQSYSEKVTVDHNNGSTFAVYGVIPMSQHTRQKQYLTNSPSKLKVDINIAALTNDLCDGAGDTTDIETEIENYLYGRARTLSNAVQLKKIHHIDLNPTIFSLAADNTKTSIKKNSGSISFDLYIFPRPSGLSPEPDTPFSGIDTQLEPLAIIEVDRTEERDQLTGRNKFKIKGSVKGIRDTTKTGYDYNNPDTLPNMYDNPRNGQTQTWANTLDIYSKVNVFFIFPDTGNILFDKRPLSFVQYPISEADSTYIQPWFKYPSTDTQNWVIALTNSKVSEFPSSHKINFEYTYEDTDKRDLLGYKLTRQYEERPAVTGRAEHIIPNRGSFNYLSNATTAPQKKITVRADFPNGCYREKVGADQGRLTSDGITKIPYKEDIHKAVSGAMEEFEEFDGPVPVDSEYGVQWLLKSESLHEGKTFISLTKEYIACDTRD